MTTPDLAGIIERDRKPPRCPAAADRRALLGLLRETREALVDEDQLAHGEAVKEDRDGGYVGLGVCAYCDTNWPCRTERNSAPILARLAALGPLP